MAANVKLDDGLNQFASNCFPARQKFKSQQPDTSSGAWLLAHRAEQRRHFKVVLCSKPRSFEEIRNQRKQAEKEGTSITLPSTTTDKISDENILDGFFLLKHCCVQDPDDLCKVNITGQNLTDAVAEDFKLFQNVAVINAAENFLTLEPFSTFAALEELQLAVNGIRGITVEHNQFSNLQKLDLSFNNLSTDDVKELGCIHQLTDLDLSGNNLNSLPVDMMESDSDRQSKVSHKMFTKLQKLIADDNKLSTATVFVALAGLPSLSHLSLQKNDIQTVPHLLAVNDRYMVQDQIPAHRPASGRRSARRSARQSARIQRHSVQFESSDNVNDNGIDTAVIGNDISDSVQTELQQTPVAETNEDLVFNIQLASNDNDTKQSTENSYSTLQPPFSSLQHLNIASNKICKEEALLGVTAWPCLRQLIIHDNPLTLSNRSSNLLIVNQFIQGKLGVQVQCQKSVLPAKHRMEMSLKSERVVNTKVPAIPRCNVEQLLLAIEAAPARELLPRAKSASAAVSAKSPLPPIASACNWSVDVDGNSEFVEKTEEMSTPSQVADGCNEGMFISDKFQEVDEAAPIFMTETGDVADVQSDSDDEEIKVDSHFAKEPSGDVDDYDLLYNIDESSLDDNLPQPRDVIGNVRALHYALNHPLVFGDTHSVQRNSHHESDHSLKLKPHASGAVRKSKLEKVTGVLNNLKSRETYVEIPLTEALASQKHTKDYTEASKLLAEVQNRYNVARIKSVGATRQPSSMLRHQVNKLKPTTITKC